MAERRMFSKKIVCGDPFTEMPHSAQALYIQLSMEADDDGFVNNAKKIQRSIGADDKDLGLLLAKRFIIQFDSGVIAIKHWKMNNYIQKDRYKPTVYSEEKEGLIVKPNGAYTERIQDVYKMDTQVRLGEDSLELGQDRAGECSVGEAAATTTDAPDLQEVIDYVQAQGLRSVNCYRFYEYYSGCNWVTSKGKPIDWRLKLREWDHGDAQRPRQTSSNPFLNILNNSN